MSGQLTQHTQSYSDLVAQMVLTALRQNELGGLSAVLRCIAEAVNAFGCILWEVAPGADFSSQPPHGRLSILAEWLQDGSIIAVYDMPLTNSANGLALLQDRPITSADMENDPQVFKNAVTEQSGFQTLCAVPIRFTDGQARRSTVCVYRKEPLPFTDREKEMVSRMASLVPELYLAIQDKVSQRLLAEINGILHDADLQAADRLLTKEQVKAVFDEVCQRISATFQCLETSIFMSDEAEEPSTYRLMSTTLPEWIPPDQVYCPQANDGLTGWGLAQKRAIRIFDLEKFSHDIRTIEQTYPGLRWKDKWNLRKKVREILMLDDKTEPPPLSYMSAPIFRGDKVLGAIRCSIARRGPYYFSDRDVELLGQVATQVGRYWANWQTRRRVEEENSSWQELVESIKNLNNFVRKELQKLSPDEARIYKEVLRITKSVISGADATDIRLFDEKSHELFYAAVDGGAWEQWGDKERKQWLALRYSVSKNADRSVGKFVYQTRKVYLTNDVESDQHYAKHRPLGAKCAITAPLSVGDYFYGVLDIRGNGERNFSSQDKNMADLLGRQLGLYLYLTEVIGQLRGAQAALQKKQAELEKSVEVQRQTYQDLAHQLKSPIVQAQARVQTTVISPLLDQRLRRNLEAVRSLCRRARRATLGMALFAALAREEPVEVAPARLSYRDLVMMLQEAAEDHELAINPNRQIRFRVNEKGLEVVGINDVRVDYNWFAEALNNVLDNAGKYSFDGTTVYISGGLTRKGKFQISVLNRGLQIRPEHVAKAKERDWRSEEAKWTTGEGQGIGLWVVDHIMKAHGGELVVVPTNSHSDTEVKLIFPVSGG